MGKRRHDELGGIAQQDIRLSLDDEEEDGRYESEHAKKSFVNFIPAEDAVGRDDVIMFRLSRDAEGNRYIMAVNSEWFKLISGWYAAFLACADSSRIVMHKIPQSCSEYCFVVLFGLMAAAYGDPGFLPTFQGAAQTEIQSTYKLKPSLNDMRGTFARRMLLNFENVVKYLGLFEGVVLRCFKYCLPRYVGTNACIPTALLCCIPVSEFEESLIDSVSGTTIIEYLCTNPKVDVNFELWDKLPRATMIDLSYILKEHRHELKCIESVAAFSMQFAMALRWSENTNVIAAIRDTVRQ